MCVLVKDDGKGIVRCLHLSVQGDVINVWSRLKVAGVIFSQFERRVGAVTFEGNDGRGYRRVELHLWKETCKDFSKLFQFYGDPPHVFFTAISNYEKVFSA